MARKITIKHVFISDDGLFSGLAWTTLLTEKQRFLHAFFANKKFLLCFLQDTISKCVFYPVN